MFMFQKLFASVAQKFVILKKCGLEIIYNGVKTAVNTGYRKDKAIKL